MTGDDAPLFAIDARGWPETDDDNVAGQAKDLFAARLEVRKQRAGQEIARAQAEIDADLAIDQEYYKGVFAVAQGSIERSRASADTVQKAAAAIVTLYTAILGVSFSAGDRPLPGRAVFAAILLGLAIALSTVYLAYIVRPGREAGPSEGVPAEDPDATANRFVSWTLEVAQRRAAWLRASVVALAASLAFLPAPFVSLGSSDGAPAAVEWPTPDPAAGNNVELQKILYAQQVKDAAAAAAEPTTDDAGVVWLLAFAVALAAVAAILRLTVPGGRAPAQPVHVGAPRSPAHPEDDD